LDLRGRVSPTLSIIKRHLWCIRQKMTQRYLLRFLRYIDLSENQALRRKAQKAAFKGE